MSKKVEKVELKGTNQEKAKQLVEISKKQKLSIETLQEVVPMTADFVKEFGIALKDLINDGRESHKECLLVLNNCMIICQTLAADNTLTGEERLQVLPLIEKATDTINKMHRRKEWFNGGKVVAGMAIIGTVLGKILGDLIKSRNGNNGPMKA